MQFARTPLTSKKINSSHPAPTAGPPGNPAGKTRRAERKSAVAAKETQNTIAWGEQKAAQANE
jgi:hypothetical protein